MKILQVNKYYYLKGGADAVFLNTSRLLRKNGHEVIPFCISNGCNTPSNYSRYFVNSPEIREQSIWGKIRSIKRFFWNSNAAQQLENLIIAEKPSVAHLHNIFNGISLSILPVLKKYGISVVVTMHDTRFICPSSYFNTRSFCRNCLTRGGLPCGLHLCYQDNFFNSWMCALEMFHKEKLFKYDDYIEKYIFVSHRFLQFHSQRHSWFMEKGAVLHNFLPDQDMIVPNKKKGDYIFFYGRITKEKGILTLFEAMKELPNVRLKVAGTGPLLDELMKRKQSNVEFIGFKSGKDLFGYLENASFVIVPSECEENNPLTIIEAYSYGKPVIGSRIGGIPEIIIEGKTGYIYEKFSKSSLIEAIKKAMAISTDMYEEMSVNARDFAEEKFCPEKHYESLMNIYKEVIGK